MKFRIVSDLHLEFSNKFRLPPLIDDADSVLILAGDICVIDEIYKFNDFFEDCSKRFKKVFYVFGNHEYYNGDMSHVLEIFNKNIKKYNNIFATECGSMTIDEYHLIGATLWTDFNNANPLDMLYCERVMNDFHLINKSINNIFKPADSINSHKKHLNFIENELINNKDKICIVISHHLPSILSVNLDKYGNSKVNAAFYSNLEDFIIQNRPKLWVHGHTHDSCEYNIFETKILANPKGYPLRFDDNGNEIYQNASFDPTLTIEL